MSVVRRRTDQIGAASEHEIRRENAMARIGILGGTFDPVHEGHLLIAESARVCLGLDRVIFIPAGCPWLKSDRAVTDAAHRLAMVELAIRDNPLFEASDMEIKRAGPTYTVDTLAELRRRLGVGVELYLILGMDSMRELGRWHRPERIFEMCAVAAVSRPGVADVSAHDLERDFPLSSGRVKMVSGPMVDMSATDIRSRVGSDSPLRGVPAAALDYIREHGLYTDGE